MSKLSIVKVIAILLLAVVNSVFAKQNEIAKYVFQNGRGERIVLTTEGLTVNGKLYPAKICSRGAFQCVKYGSMFAIIAPSSCSAIDSYRWHVNGVNSFVIALSPHDPHDVLLSTNYGGVISFGYQGKGGVSYLFYDPAIRIGIKSVWRNIDHVDLDKVRYKKVQGQSFFSCS